jgi:hypothetical protein
MDMGESCGTFEPGEALALEALEAHPFAAMLAARGWSSSASWLGAGRRTLLGLCTACPSCGITWMATAAEELVIVDFERRGARLGLHSPLRDMREFLRLAATPGSGFRIGVAKIKRVGDVEGALGLERLTEAYRRLFHFVELGRDERGFRWIGRLAADFHRENP